MHMALNFFYDIYKVTFPDCRGTYSSWEDFAYSFIYSDVGLPFLILWCSLFLITISCMDMLIKLQIALECSATPRYLQ